MSEEYEMDEDDMGMDMDMAGESNQVFWSMAIEPNKQHQIEQPEIPGYIVHLTNACFGVNVQKQSRTVVMVQCNDDDEEEESGSGKKPAVPICVLRQGAQENHTLDLLFNESVTISVEGQKPSTVYLTGYLQPPIEPEDVMNPLDEDMTEAEFEKTLKAQRRQRAALDDEDLDEEEEDDEEEPNLIDESAVAPPTKKQKTSSGSKPTKNGDQSASNKRKSPQQKPATAPSTDDTKEKEKEKETKDSKDNKQSGKQKEKGKSMQNMKGGIKFRDMKVGDGKPIAHGQKLKVYYVGQTDDKKVFDKCISGAGFEFSYGKGDVIKGWDMGLKGMKVGGKRKLVIPSKLAYGAEGSPPQIKPNANLTFTIEVKSAN